MLGRRMSSALVEPRRRSRVARAGGVAGMVAGAVIVVAGCSGVEPTESSSSSPSEPVDRPSMVVYRTPTCGCCESYEDYLRRHDVEIRSEVRDDLTSIRADNGVPTDAASCHTVLVDGYAVEGHVPLEAIDQLLAERPAVDGIGIPGMPTNAPGMGEPDGRPLHVVSFDGGRIAPFATL